MLHYNTVNKLLHETLIQLMTVEEFSKFRLVGGTSLSLQIGHRESVDIDLFSDNNYGTIDFNVITEYLQENFSYVFHSKIDPGMGRSYFIGENADNTVKIDVFYTDTFIEPPLVVDGIRMATVAEIIAMKLDVVQRSGRKKDFWDLHALFENYSVGEMLQLHEQRYPYTHDKELIIHNLTDFYKADDDFAPICLLGKYWEFIKDDIQEIVGRYKDETAKK